MQLAYGKFDPGINRPSFDVIEIDLFQYFSWKPKVSTIFRSWVKRKKIKMIPRIGIRTPRSADAYREAVDLWREEFSDETIYFSVHAGRKTWSVDLCLKEIKKLSSVEQYFFEWGKGDSLQSTDFISRRECFQGYVIDPDWHSSSVSRLKKGSLHFKLHGWNQERWVRRYGDKKAARILRVMRDYPESVLTLSYSGKTVEAPLFYRQA